MAGGINDFSNTISELLDPLFYGALIAIWSAMPLRSTPLALSYSVSPAFSMFGICISQTWAYIHANDDRWPLRTFVGFILYARVPQYFKDYLSNRATSLFVLGCTLLDAFMLHHYFVGNYGNLITLSQVTPEISMFILLNSVVVVACDLCFATRVWRLRRVHWAITVAIVVAAIGAMIPAITLVDSLFKFPGFAQLNTRTRKLEIGFSNISSAVSQSMSTFALWYSFHAHMSEVSTRQPILKRLRNVIINRGALLTVDQLLVAILFLARPQRLYWYTFHQFLAPLYLITTLATLNARRPPRAQSWQIEVTSEIPYSPTYPTPTGREGGFSGRLEEGGMRQRESVYPTVTPYPLSVATNHTPSSSVQVHVGNGHPLQSPATRKRRTFPRQAFALLSPDLYRRKTRARKGKSIATAKEPTSPAPLSPGNSDISLTPLTGTHETQVQIQVESEENELQFVIEAETETATDSDAYLN
ncbi:hypothetical protein V5O48_007131 [Marasmius crinis-equi]|uniref:DUF6534 domain-containing protein n=1 Tax=Marasmius crinis-equi TaxID=585013 RepID=A0ABR3FHJ1_9AGAR